MPDKQPQYSVTLAHPAYRKKENAEKMLNLK